MRPESTSQQLPWPSRLYPIRVTFVVMALLALAASEWACHSQSGGHFWIILFGATYPHVGHLLLGRLEGRSRKGNAILVIDGFFCGAVMAVIGLASPFGVVMAAIILFNWMAAGGLSLAALGITATLAGVMVSGMPDVWLPHSPCMVSDALAGFTLIGYFFVLGWSIHHQMVTLRQQQAIFQARADVATQARKLADQALMSVLPNSAAEILATKGELPPEALDDATVLLIEFVWEQSPPPSIGDLASCFQITDVITGRHGFECIKTFGRRYLSLSRIPTGPLDAIHVVQEISNHLRDHQSLLGIPAAQCSVLAFVHCGTLDAGLVQPSRLNFELVGEPMEALVTMAASCSGFPAGTVVASTAVQRRMPNKSEFVATPAGASGTVYLFRLASSS